MSKYFEISGYWKDTLENFENYIVKEDNGEEEQEKDENIFFCGLTEDNIKDCIAFVWGTTLDFVITDYKEIEL